ncbi:putative membrane protein [Streptomyces tendae]
MRVSHVIARIAAESFRVAALMPVPAEGGGASALGPVTAWVAHDGQGGVLRDVHVARLVRVARGHGVVLRLVPRIGDFLVPGTPVLAVHGGAAPPRRALRYALSVGVERTFHQDLAFGLRQLSDIGLRALSPAVNDPTTAVQALDRVVQILATLSRRPLDAALHRDRRGVVRLVQPVPGWAELVDLGFAEVRVCSVGSPQVTRRLLAGLDDLLLLVPPERREPLLRHRELLRQAVERTAPTPADRAFALRPDRQGIG